LGGYKGSPLALKRGWKGFKKGTGTNALLGI